MLLAGLGVLAVTVDATPEPVGPRWLGRIDHGMPFHEAKATRLLSATAIGLGTELRALGDTQSRLEARLRSIDALGSAELVSVRDALADLTRRQASIETRLTAAAQLAAVKNDAPSLVDEVRALRLVAAALLLREGARSAQPFGPALDRFAAIAASVDGAYLEPDLPPVTDLIAALQPYAGTGVVSSRDLRRSFASLAGLIDRAESPSWWDSMLVMVGWRDDRLAPLYEAQAALMVDDLEDAIASLGELRGEAALVVDGWLTLARARLAADAIVDDLYQLALAAGATWPAAGSALASSGAEATAGPASWRAAQTTMKASSLSR